MHAPGGGLTEAYVTDRTSSGLHAAGGGAGGPWSLYWPCVMEMGLFLISAGGGIIPPFYKRIGVQDPWGKEKGQSRFHWLKHGSCIVTYRH